MENGPLHDDKLFRAVNERLSNYEAPQEGADWDAMSRALDQLPKTSRMKWKFSLNSILIGIGIVGISILGYALSASGGKKDAPEKAVVAAPPSKEVNTPTYSGQSYTVNYTNTTNAQTNVNEPSTAVVPNSNTSASNSSADSRTLRKQKDKTDGFLFGDQIDRRKGFIYHTKENQALVDSHTDSVPSTYYDYVDGHIKKIKVDPNAVKQNKPADSAANSSSNGAPTGSDQQGFDFQGNF